MKKYLNGLKEAHWLFLIIAIFFGVYYAKIVPPLWGLDEPSHFYRTYQIAHGHFLLSQNSLVPSNLVSLGDYTVGDLVDNNTGGIFNRADVRDEGAYIRYMNQPFSAEFVHPSETAGYAPIAYAGSSIGTAVAGMFGMKMGRTLLLARLGSLVFYVTIIFVAIWLLRRSKLKWLFMIAALLPTSLFQGSVVSADGMLIATSLLFLSLLIVFMKKETHDKRQQLWLWIGIIATAITLPLIKLNYIFLSSAIFLTPSEAFGKFKKFSIAIKSSIVLIGGAIGLLWVKEMGGLSDSAPSLRSDGAIVSSTQQLSGVLHNPLHFLAACVRSLIQYGDNYINTLTTQVGWNYIGLPMIVTFIICGAIIIAAVYAKDELIALRKNFIAIGILSMIGTLSIFGALYLAFTPVGSKFVDGVQGRYMLPFLIPLVILIAAYLPLDIKIKKPIIPFIFTFVSTSVLIASVIFYTMATY